MRLAIITTHPIQYNAPFFKELTKYVQVKVFYTKERGNSYDPEFRISFDWDIPLLDGYSYEFVKTGLNKRVKAFNPDEVIVYGWNHFKHLSFILSYKGKISFRGDSHLLDRKPGIKTAIKRKFLQWLYSRIDTAYYVGTNNKKYFEWAGVKKLVFVPHAVDNLRFSPKVNEGENVLFLYAGKFIEKKNVGALIAAFRQVHSSRARLILAGSGPLESALRDQAKGDNRIFFLPFHNQSEMPDLYRLADVFVLPSKENETWGLSINEAMASGLAVICSAHVGCSPDLVKGTGIIVNDTSELWAAIEKLTCEPLLLQACKANSIRKIESWSVQVSAARLAEHLTGKKLLKTATKAISPFKIPPV